MEDSLYLYLQSRPEILAITDDRIYPWHLPQGQNVFPVLTFQTISSNHDYSLTGAAGIVTQRIQFDYWGHSLKDVLRLARAVRLRLQGFIGDMAGTDIAFIQLDTELDLHEGPEDGSDQWLYHRVQDYMIKFYEEVPTFDSITVDEVPTAGLKLTGTADISTS
jgi:hypothetical protein